MRGELIKDTFGSLYLWEHPIPGRQYAIGVDTSSGVHGADKQNDPAAACVIEMESCRQVAEWSGYYIPTLWGWRVARLGWYFNEAHLAIETQPSPHGIAVYDACVRYGYGNLSCQFKVEQIAGSLSDRKGWQRAARSTEHWYNRGREALNEGCVIRSEGLLDELAGTNVVEGKLDTKTKNDRIIAWVLALLARDQAYAKGEIKKKEAPIEDLADAYWRRELAVVTPDGSATATEREWDGCT